MTVNGSAATISGSNWSKALSLATNTTHTITIVATDRVGNQSTATRYVRIEAYYQQAARVAGTTVQSSLDNTLSNSTVCTAIAGNGTAYGIMKTRYSSNMSSKNNSYVSSGLNLLCYKCNCKTWLYHAGITCGEIVGSWDRVNDSGTYMEPSDWNYCATAQGWNTTAINFTGFSTCYASVYASTSVSHTLIGTTTSKTHTQDLDTSKYLNCYYNQGYLDKYISFSLANSQCNAYIRICLNNSNQSGSVRYRYIYII